MSQSTPTTMLKAVVLALAGAVLMFLLVGMLLAKGWHVDTTRSIEAPPQRVGELVTDLSTWDRWSGMKADLGPQTTTTITGSPHAAGQAITWTGKRGCGIFEVTGVGATSMDYVVKSQAPEGGTAHEFARGHIEWRADGSRSVVTWHEERESDDIIGRWFAWFGAIQEGVRRIQVGSLSGLAQELEAPAPAGAK